jgi:hypothetical protein
LNAPLVVIVVVLLEDTVAVSQKSEEKEYQKYVTPVNLPLVGKEYPAKPVPVVGSTGKKHDHLATIHPLNNPTQAPNYMIATQRRERKPPRHWIGPED